MPGQIASAVQMSGELRATLESQSALTNASLQNLGDLSTRIDTEDRETADLASTSVDFYFKFSEDINSRISVQEGQDAAAADQSLANSTDDDAWILQAFTTGNHDFNTANYRLPSGSAESLVGVVQLKHQGANVDDGLYQVKLTINASEAGVLSASCVLDGEANATSAAIAEAVGSQQVVYFNTVPKANAFSSATDDDNDAVGQDKLQDLITLAEVLAHIGGQSALDTIANLYDGESTIKDVSASVNAVAASTNSALSKFGRKRFLSQAGRVKANPFNSGDKIVLGTSFAYKVEIAAAAAQAIGNGNNISGVTVVASTPIFAVIQQN